MLSKSNYLSYKKNRLVETLSVVEEMVNEKIIPGKSDQVTLMNHEILARVNKKFERHYSPTALGVHMRIMGFIIKKIDNLVGYQISKNGIDIAKKYLNSYQESVTVGVSERRKEKVISDRYGFIVTWVKEDGHSDFKIVDDRYLLPETIYNLIDSGIEQSDIYIGVRVNMTVTRKVEINI